MQPGGRATPLAKVFRQPGEAEARKPSQSCRLTAMKEMISVDRRYQSFVSIRFRKDVFGPRFGDGANSTDIHAMISGEGEEIPFYKMLKAWHLRHQVGALLVEPPERR